MTDILLQHTDDGGDFEIEGGRVTLDRGPATAAYLSLFGGNELDDGSTATARAQWWGNLLEHDRSRHLRSETQALLVRLPATEENLPRIADAASRDLAWMTAALDATVEVEARLPAPKRIRIEITIDIDGDETVLPPIDERWGSE